MKEKKSTLYYYDQLVIYAPKMFIKFGSAANVSNINIAPLFVLYVWRRVVAKCSYEKITTVVALHEFNLKTSRCFFVTFS